MSTPLQENELIDRIIDLSDLAADLYHHEEDHLRERILALVDLTKNKLNLITLKDGRKAKKFKETQTLIEQQYGEVVSTIVSKTRSLIQDITPVSIGQMFAEYNPTSRQHSDTKSRNLYKEILEITERLSILLHKLEG